MKYLRRQNNLLKKRSALKTLGLLSLSPALAGLGISSMKDVKEIYIFRKILEYQTIMI